MKTAFIFVGKTKDAWIQSGESEFVKRLQKFAQLEFRIVSEEGKGDEERIKKEEGKRILEKIKKDEFVCLLDLHGKELSSGSFAKHIEKWRDFHGGKVTFVIAGSYGYSQEVIERSDFRICFSKMTFTHQMIRVFLLEQVYRAFSILQGSEYHK